MRSSTIYAALAASALLVSAGPIDKAHLQPVLRVPTAPSIDPEALVVEGPLLDSSMADVPMVQPPAGGKPASYEADMAEIAAEKALAAAEKDEVVGGETVVAVETTEVVVVAALVPEIMLNSTMNSTIS
ncbi:hypothetical protein BJ546DRAFT_1059632 [Cryomyces antarcticus]|uniref:Uncharacterized protein n=1 Tax=Cryomyces antarcticus TaxID=329879 RepID=A0ABR0MAC3_9PEZI|nr:hypothetical protein LTR16_002000 [Cryomyces antarcticus]